MGTRANTSWESIRVLGIEEVICLNYTTICLVITALAIQNSAAGSLWPQRYRLLLLYSSG